MHKGYFTLNTVGVNTLHILGTERSKGLQYCGREKEGVKEYHDEKQVMTGAEIGKCF